MAKDRVVAFWWDNYRVHVERASGKERTYKADSRYGRKHSVYNLLTHGHYGDQYIVPVAAEVKLTDAMRKIIVGLETKSYYAPSPFNMRTLLNMLAGGYITIPYRGAVRDEAGEVIGETDTHWLTGKMDTGSFWRNSKFVVTDKGRVAAEKEITAAKTYYNAKYDLHSRLEAELPHITGYSAFELSVTEDNRLLAQVGWGLVVKSSHLHVDQNLFSAEAVRNLSDLLIQAAELMSKFKTIEEAVRNDR